MRTADGKTPHHVAEKPFDEPSNGARQRRALPGYGTILSRCVIRGLIAVLNHSDHFDFNVRALRQGGNLHGRTRWRILFEIGAVYFVYRLKIAHIGEVNRGFDNVVESNSASSQDGSDVLHYATGLRGDVAGNDLARLRVEGNLPAAK